MKTSMELLSLLLAQKEVNRKKTVTNLTSRRSEEGLCQTSSKLDKVGTRCPRH